jgi:hypothetical protein
MGEVELRDVDANPVRAAAAAPAAATQ